MYRSNLAPSHQIQRGPILPIRWVATSFILAALGLFLNGCTSVDLGTEGMTSTASLKVGSPAPALDIAKVVQGPEVSEITAGQVYVIEFWATWCGPCVQNMPHLGKIQQRYGDKVKVIGVSDESGSTVESFLSRPSPTDPDKTMGQVATYTIALDNQSAMNNSYMAAANQNGIPCAFIIGKDSKIRWIGHPSEMDRVLASVVNE